MGNASIQARRQELLGLRHAPCELPQRCLRRSHSNRCPTLHLDLEPKQGQLLSRGKLPATASGSRVRRSPKFGYPTPPRCSEGSHRPRRLPPRSSPEYGTMLDFGAWRSLASAPALGAGGRRFESSRPDFTPSPTDSIGCECPHWRAFSVLWAHFVGGAHVQLQSTASCSSRYQEQV